MSYQIFTRNWYKKDGTPNHNGRKQHIKYVETEQEAREYCQKWNADRPTSWLKVSKKYEYTSA